MDNNKSSSSEEYFDESLKEDLKKQNEKTCNGYLIIVDIKDSTLRKNKFKGRWIKHTYAIYKSFSCMIEKIKQDFSNELEIVTVKFIGDASMAFIKTSYSSSPSEDEKFNITISEKILKHITNYLDEITIIESLIGEIRLKTVITYLTEINIVDIGNIDKDIKDNNKNNEDNNKDKKSKQQRDVLGRGIDFSFRLEKFADSSHIVINEMFKKSVENYINSKSNNEESIYRIVECKKRIKGWKSEYETFYILTNDKMIKDTIEIYEPSFYSDNVNMELFKDYVSNTNVKIKEKLANLDNDNKEEEKFYNTIKDEKNETLDNNGQI